MTQDELIAENLAALGISGAQVSPPSKSNDRVFEAYVELIREKGRPVTAIDVADHTGICSSRISLVARGLAKQGRMRKLTDLSTGKTVYIPIVPRPAAASPTRQASKKRARG